MEGSRMSADLYLLLMYDAHTGWHGMGILPNYNDPMYRNGLQAYVQLSDSTTKNWALICAHELGHNFGAGHNVKERDPARMLEDGWYNYGYMIPNSQKRTIMS